MSKKPVIEPIGLSELSEECDSRKRDFESELGELVNHVPGFILKNLKNEQKPELYEMSGYNFKLESKLIRPRFILNLAFCLAELAQQNRKDFKNSLNFEHTLKWASAVEMIHNSSLYHVS